MTRLAVVIVSWNVRPLLADCLRSLCADLAQSNIESEIWVVDNASEDGSAAMVAAQFPGVRLIASRDNLGFAGGNNAALRAMGFAGDAATPPDVVFLLNPDTIVQPGATAALTGFLEQNPRAGIAGARLSYGDGSFQHSAFDFPGLRQLACELLPLPGRLLESRFNGRYPRARYEASEPFKIGHPLGAAFCVRRQAIEQVGLLDEAYHMYVEEVDWCRRITQAGWGAYCVPAAHIIHLGGQSTGQVKTQSLLNLWRSRCRFYQQHYGPLKRYLARQLVGYGFRQRIRQEAADPALSPTERANRRAAYQQIIQIWQGDHA